MIFRLTVQEMLDRTMKPFLCWQLAFALLRRPTYKVIIVCRDYIPPSPWSDEFTIEVDDTYRVVRICCDLT